MQLRFKPLPRCSHRENKLCSMFVHFVFRSKLYDVVDNMLKAKSGSWQLCSSGDQRLSVTDNSDLTLFVRCSQNNIIDICDDSMKHIACLDTLC